MELLTDFCACTGCSILTIWPSFARKRVRRPRPSTSTCSQYIFCAGRCKRAPLRSRACLLHPQRPRAAASCGAAAAGQETSRSPAQGRRRPPAVSLAETESHAAGQATERGRRTGHCSLHRPPVPPCHAHVGVRTNLARFSRFEVHSDKF